MVRLTICRRCELVHGRRSSPCVAQRRRSRWTHADVSDRSKVEKDDRKMDCVSTDLITLCLVLWWVVAPGDDVQNVWSAGRGKVGWWKTLSTKGEKAFFQSCLLGLVSVALVLEDYNMSERSHECLDDRDCWANWYRLISINDGNVRTHTFFIHALIASLHALAICVMTPLSIPSSFMHLSFFSDL